MYSGITRRREINEAKHRYIFDKCQYSCVYLFTASQCTNQQTDDVVWSRFCGAGKIVDRHADDCCAADSLMFLEPGSRQMKLCGCFFPLIMYLTLPIAYSNI